MYRLVQKEEDMGSQEIDVTVDTPATRDAVWAVLADSADYATWGVWDESSIERPGQDGQQGLGAIRRLRQGRRTLREEVVTFEPSSRFDYAVLSGIPVRDYVGRVTLTYLDGGGTRISWRSTFSALPILDRIIQRKLTDVIRDVATRMAAHAASAPTGRRDEVDAG
jgi:hypothetical protein